MESNMKNVNDISELLPEGLSHEAVSEIATMVSEVINSTVNEKTNLLEAKVNAFIRTKVDELKVQAIKELEDENPVFKNAKLFESVRSLMSLELNGQDEDNAVMFVNQQKDELQEEVDALTQELNKLLIENQNLVQSTTISNSKVNLLERSVGKLQEEKAHLGEEILSLESSQVKPFKSSEKAIIVSESEEGSQRTYNDNEFLTNDVMKYMPFNTKGV